MRTLSAALFVCVCVLSVAAYAPQALAATGTQLPATYPAGCPKGASTGDPSGTQTFTTDQLPKLQGYLEQVVYCANPCYDEHVSVQVSVGVLSATTVTIPTTVTNKCGTKNPTAADITKANRGCAKGQTQPSIIINVPAITLAGIPAKTIGPKSRCDPAIGKIANSMFAAASNKDVTGFQNGLTALAQLPPQAAPIQDAGTDALTTALTGLGVPQDQAAAIANNSNSDDLLNAIRSGDSATIKTALQSAADAAGVTLNPDVLQNISQLTPTEVAADTTAATTGDTQPGSGDTFDASDNKDAPSQNTGLNTLPTRCGIDGIAGNIMGAESACGSNTYNPLANVHGPFQYLCSTWAGDTAATGYSQYSDCSYANDPTISAAVVNARYALYDQQYGSQCEGAGLTDTSCMYAIHVFGEPGFNKMLAAAEANPNAPASSLCGTALQNIACSNNASIINNGGTVAGVFSELDRRLTGSSAVASAVNPNSNVFSTASNPYVTLSPTAVGYAAAAPFGSVSSGYSLAQPQQVVQTQTQTSAPSTSNTTSYTPVSYTPATQTTPPPLPAAIIIAQPSEIFPGDPVQVSWSSVGMRPDIPCKVVVNGTFLFAVSNEGTKLATTTGAQAGQSLAFALQCTALSGISVNEATSVSIQ